MNKLRLFFFACFACFAGTAQADFEIKYYLTITNIPAGLTTNLVLNIGTATTRHWTNSASGAPSTSIPTTNSTAASATNLLAHLNNYLVYSVGSSGPSLGVDSVSSNTSTLVFTAPENTNLTVSFGGNWARGFYVTNPLTAGSTILWPTNSMSPRARTNAMNSIVNLLASGIVPSNSFPPANYAFRHYTDNTSAQTLSNKTLTGAVLTGGRLTLATNITATNVFLTNVTIHIAAITGADLSGLINLLTNGTAYNLNLVNATNRGIVAALTNGLSTNLTLIGAKSTNFFNHGPLASRYNVVGGQAFGEDSVASGINSTAVGRNATSSGVESSAFGYCASAIASSATAVGNSAQANANSTTVAGYASTVSTSYSGTFGAANTISGERSYAFGYNNTLTHSNTVLVGNQLTSSGDNLIELGSSAQTVSIPGLLGSFVSTNAIFKGTNVLNGRLDITSRANTGLANGYNSGVIFGTNVYVRFSGPSAAYTNAGFAAPGGPQFVHAQFDNPGLSFTILNESGLEVTAANRILTGTGSATPLNSTNNPVMATFLYDDTASRWRILSFR